jgi:hypothetical protein
MLEIHGSSGKENVLREHRIRSMSCVPGCVAIIIQIIPVISSHKTHLVHREGKGARLDIETAQAGQE